MIEHLPASWTAEVREVIEAERRRRDPPREVAAQLRRDLLERLAVQPERPAIAAAAPGRRRLAFAFPWGSRGLRLVPKAARGSFLGSLFAFAPLALAGLGSATLVGIGSFLAMRSGVLPTFTLTWDHPPIAQPAPTPPGFDAIDLVEPSTSAAPTHFVAQNSSRPQPVSSATASAVSDPTARRPARRPPAVAPTPAVPAPPAAPIVIVPAIAPTDPAFLALEGRLLEEARQALRAGVSSTALRSLAEAEKVRSNALAEEREALTVVALARSGDTREAARRMSIFTARYPQSIYLSRLHLEMSAHEDVSQ